MAPIRISPRHLGKMESETFCPRCFWYQIIVGFHPPFESHMPGIMHNLDRFEKKLVEGHFEAKGVAPRWLSKLCCTGIVEFPAKMTMEVPELELTLVGMPDAVFRKKDGTLYVVDYKTAKCKGADDPFMCCYETQLLGYAELLEDAGVGDVTSAALIYFENQVAAYSEEPLSLLSTEGLNVPFAVKIHPVNLDRKRFRPLLKRFREYADLTAPPEGLSDCEECERLALWFDTEERRRNSDKFLRSANSVQRDFVLRHRLQDHRERLAAVSGHWEREIEYRGTDCFDSTPADWDI